MGFHKIEWVCIYITCNHTRMAHIVITTTTFARLIQKKRGCWDENVVLSQNAKIPIKRIFFLYFPSCISVLLFSPKKTQDGNE